MGHIKGVGEKRAALYLKLGVESVLDLLYHFPRGYIDLSKPYTIREAPLFEPCAVRAVLTQKSGERLVRRGLSIWKFIAEDETGMLQITIFNSRYTAQQLSLDTPYIFYGRVGATLTHREISSPDIYPAQGPGILPVYPQTAGLTSRFIQRHIRGALDEITALSDIIPPTLREREGFDTVINSLRDIHFPPSIPAAKAARGRFIYEELLTLSCALETSNTQHRRASATPMAAVDFERFYSTLPFAPTRAQRRCIQQAAADMMGGTPMNRLIQGDVGSGKTLVAVACVYMAAKSGMQSAVMAPTAILAEQHFTTMGGMLAPFGLKTELLTSGLTGAKRKKIFDRLAAGEVDLLVGTHALLSGGVEFASLGLVVTDEQHRFGVAQRAKLSQKSEGAHVLVMSATPIPRTLSLIIYGDLSLSVLDEKPPGRIEIETLLIDGGKRTRAIGFIRDNLDNGRQAYIVCPLIEQGEADLGLKPAIQYAGAIAENELAGYSVGLLHGRMKAREKEETMRSFKAGEIQVLVSTTVVEVGVDVPGATIIMIENAERFGLSQLHQLRGRVGRSSEKSWCILVSDSKSRETLHRLGVMKNESDGFRIAEEDLAIRGPGDFFGLRQHGLPTLRIADLADDISLMQKAREDASALMANAPGLAGFPALLERVENMLNQVGQRPN